MNHLRLFFLLCAALYPAAALADTIISINIAGGNEDAPGTGVPAPAGQGIVTGNAGIGQFGNWNNLVGTSGSVSTVNSDGDGTGAVVEWATNNTWSTNTADGAGGDVDLMSGYLDNFNANGSITISGLGAEFTTTGYEVLVYFNNDNDDNTGGFVIEDSNANTDTRFGHQDTANGNYPLAGGVDGYVISEETDSATTMLSNVVRLTGLDGTDFTLTGIAGTGVASLRSRPNAIQIITQGNPLDVDGDGLADDWETANGLSPLDDGSVDENNGPDGDPDMDGSSNLEEFIAVTDPQDSDTDDDDLMDGVENETGIYVSPTQTGSNPRVADTDGDTLNDGSEVMQNPFFSNPNLVDTDGDTLNDDFEVTANPFVTNPSAEDTDSDTFSDKVEINLGSDPTDAGSIPEFVSSPRIGINFSSDRDGAAELAADEVAGFPGFAQAGWNNYIGIPANGTGLMGDTAGIVSPNAGVVSEEDGNQLAGVTVNWSALNSWNTNNGTSNPDNKLMNGYLDNSAASPELVQVDVGNLPLNYTIGEGYTVVAYFGSDGNDRTGTVGVVGAETYSFSTSSNQGASFPTAYALTEDTAAGNPSSNYAVWTGLTSPTLQLRVVRVGGNCGIHGIQIISSEAGTPLEITDIEYDEENNMVTLTWNSVPEVIYAIDVSTDLQSWPGDVDDSVESDGETTTRTFAGPPEGTERVYYRVRVSE